jgi:hypothetical protein
MLTRSIEAAEAPFAEFAGEWEQLYPAMIQACNLIRECAGHAL